MDDKNITAVDKEMTAAEQQFQASLGDQLNGHWGQLYGQLIIANKQLGFDIGQLLEKNGILDDMVAKLRAQVAVLQSRLDELEPPEPRQELSQGAQKYQEEGAAIIRELQKRE